MAGMSWERVARGLRGRIFDEPCSQHYSIFDPDNCAHCADNRAVAIYDAKRDGSSDLEWEDVAHKLAGCLDASHCDQHRRITVDCPFCDDVRAYQTYIRKVQSTGRQVRDRFEGTVNVSVNDIIAGRINPDGSPVV